MKKILVLLLTLLSACAAKTAGPVNSEMLIGQKFILRSVNGVPFSSSDQTPEIEFLENMQVSGRICNYFSGAGTLKNGILTVPEAASTMMLCADEALNRMDGELAAMLNQGAALRLEGENLTLSSGGMQYTYVRAR